VDISSLYRSPYLNAADLGGRDVQSTIERVAIEAIGKTQEQKPILYLKGCARGLILNKTNAVELARAFGQDTDAWSGQRVILRIEQVVYDNRIVPSIRVHEVPNATKVAPLPPASTAPLASQPQTPLPPATQSPWNTLPSTW